VNLIVPASPAETKTAAGAYALVFHKYGDRYFLTGIKLADSRIAYALPQTGAEAELRAQNVPVTEEILVASIKRAPAA
jgi:hypothetical protein